MKACRIIVLLFCLWAGLPRKADAAPSPNIVYILADDLGYGDLSCQNPSSRIRTPRLDRLANEGISFTSAHAPSSLCTPSRYSILTGQYCWRTRLKSGVLNMWDEPLLARERLTLPGLLRNQGYTTGCFGKWHLGLAWPFVGTVPSGFDASVKSSAIDWTRRIGGGPVDHGFDYFFGINIPNQPPYAYLENDHVAGVPNVEYESVRGLQSHWAGPGVPGWDWSQVLPTVVSNAGAWVERCVTRNPAQPFFLYLSLPGPHQPVVPTPQFSGTSQAGLYGDYVQELDWAVGELLDKLAASGVATNTLVIFTSDNGPDEFAYQRRQQYGHSSMGELRGIKNDLWEGGHRVPFIARWPGKIAGGTTSSQTICHVDLMRTVADLLRVTLPADAAQDSISFLPALVGSSTNPARLSLILESGPGQFGLWTNNWMYIDAATGDGHDPELEPLWFKQSRAYSLTNAYPALLYNLTTDLAEGTNLYGKELALSVRLEAELREARSSQVWFGTESGSWGNCSNWSQSRWPNGYDLIYSNTPGAANFTQTLGTNFSINTWTIGDLAHPVTLLPAGVVRSTSRNDAGGFTLTISNGIDMCSAGSDLRAEIPVELGGSQVWNVGTPRTLTMDGPINFNGMELKVCGAGNVIFTNELSGAGRLVMRGSGFLVLAGSSNFKEIEVSGGGFLVVRNDHALGQADLEIPNNSTVQLEPGVSLTNSIHIAGEGATFQNICRGAITMYHPGNANSRGPVMLTADSGVYAHSPESILSFTGSIGGPGNLTIMPGAGTIVFAAKNHYNGSTLIQGRLKLVGGVDRLPADSQVSIANANGACLDLNGSCQNLGSICGGGTNGGNLALGGGTLILNQTVSSTYAGSITGSGKVLKAKAGTLILSGLCSYTGTTIVNGGTLLVEGTLADTSVTVTNGTLGGTGVMNGPVSIGRGGWLAPGEGLGNLTISNTLALDEQSTTAVDIDGVRQMCGRIVGLRHVTYGGTLLVNNVAGPGTLAAGQTFHIVGSDIAEGQFTAISPTPGPGLVWNFIPATGILKIMAQPLLHTSVAYGRNLLLSWSEPGFHLQAQTNSPSGGLTNWFDYPLGSSSPVLVPLVPNQALFLRLVSP